MCKFCNLELNKRMILCHKNFPYDFGNSYYNKFPEDIKEYISYMSEVNDEGFEWRICNNRIILIMYNEGGYNSTYVECKFCPKCGRKLDAEELNGKK